MTSPTPVVYGYRQGRQIVVPDCPFCGEPHYHGDTGERMTNRESHCLENHGRYQIRVMEGK